MEMWEHKKAQVSQEAFLIESEDRCPDRPGMCCPVSHEHPATQRIQSETWKCHLRCMEWGQMRRHTDAEV
jgi:hypothetical protein